MDEDTAGRPRRGEVGQSAGGRGESGADRVRALGAAGHAVHGHVQARAGVDLGGHAAGIGLHRRGEHHDGVQGEPGGARGGDGLQAVAQEGAAVREGARALGSPAPRRVPAPAAAITRAVGMASS